MSSIPELQLLKLRLHQLRQWLGQSPFGQAATLIGAFVLIYCLIGLLIISIMFVFAVNPTLVISVIAAPLWIGVIFLAWRLARFFFGR
jgi:hypothetical protein